MTTRIVRIVLGLLGLAALAYGALLVARFAVRAPRVAESVAGFLIGGPVLHDALVAPLVAVLGLLIGRLLPGRWRSPVRVGAAISGVLGLLSVPALWRTYAGLRNPGLDDRNYPLGLLIALAVVWSVVLLGGLVRGRVGRPARGSGTTRPPAVRSGSAD